jgi:hypothetical protein
MTVSTGLINLDTVVEILITIIFATFVIGGLAAVILFAAATYETFAAKKKAPKR